MNPTSYSETYAELQNLLQSLERENTTVDELSDKLDRGFQLLTELREKLTSVEARVGEIINARAGSREHSHTEDEP
jgi:exodeoxyribonuclease VII small subunit